MAAKRKAPPPPPAPQASSSDEDSSSDEEEQKVVAPAPVVSSQQKPTHRPTAAADEDDESETVSDSDSDIKPGPSASKPVTVSTKPSESKESSDEDEEEPEVENPKSPSRKAASEPDAKKQKLSAAAALRIWSEEDEMALLRALSEYHAKNGKLPSSKDYASFLSTVSGSIGFPVNEKQLSNKIRTMKHKYSKKKEKGTDAKFSKPRDKLVFDMSTKLFNDVKVSKLGIKQSRISDTKSKKSSSDKEIEDGSVAGEVNGGMAQRGAANSDAPAKSNFYFRSFVEDMIREQQIHSCLSVEDIVAQIGESRARKMNAKIKMLMSDTLKLHANEENLKAELFGTLREMMAED